MSIADSFGLRRRQRDTIPEAEPPAFIARRPQALHPEHEATAPPPVDPLDPKVGELLSHGIVNGRKLHVRQVIAAIRRYRDHAEAYLQAAEAWGKAEIARAESQARDIAESHASMLNSQQRFFEIAPQCSVQVAEKSPEETAIEEGLATLAREVGEKRREDQRDAQANAQADA